MRIERRKNDRGSAKPIREELREFLHRDRADTSICAADCPNASPGRCSRHCPDIPGMISSDPESYPIETRVAPLVYELKRLEVFQPCWSCEGHNGTDGTLWKNPSVWFYCSSVVQLRVLANSIKDLHLKDRLSTPWRVALTFSDDDNPDTTFSLEPCLEDPGPSLALLQRDIDTIAEHLPDSFVKEAGKLSATTS